MIVFTARFYTRITFKNNNCCKKLELHVSFAFIFVFKKTPPHYNIREFPPFFKRKQFKIGTLHAMFVYKCLIVKENAKYIYYT